MPRARWLRHVLSQAPVASGEGEAADTLNHTRETERAGRPGQAEDEER